MRVVVVGAGPAGLAVVEALLARADGDLAVEWLERSPRPDAMLRHGPAPGARVLHEVAVRLDTVLRDPRVRFSGGVEVGLDVAWDELGELVVRATGAPADLPLRIPGADAVGVGTVTYLRAARAGSADVYGPAIDPLVDSAVALAPAAADTADLAREVARVDLPTGVEPIALVGRNRVRAVRVSERTADGRLRIRDLRAQLVLRPHDAHRRFADVPTGVHVVGWAGRDAVAGGSHAEDAAAVADAVLNSPDSGVEPRPPALDRCCTALSAQFSAVAEVETLLARFAGEGTLPRADYDALLLEADDD